MKYKLLVAKDFIGSVHHVQGSADNRNTTWDSYCVTNAFHSSCLPSILLCCLCEKHHHPLPAQQAYLGGQKLKPSPAIIIKTSSGFVLELLGAPWRCVLHKGHSCDRLTPQSREGRSPSDDERSTPLSRCLCTPFANGLAPPPLWKDLMEMQACPETSLTRWWEVWFKSTHQCSARAHHPPVSPVCKYLIQTGRIIDPLSFSRICMITRSIILVIHDCPAPERDHLPPRQLTVQVTDEE